MVGNLFVLCGAVELLVTLEKAGSLMVEGGNDLFGVDRERNVEAVSV